MSSSASLSQFHFSYNTIRKKKRIQRLWVKALWASVLKLPPKPLIILVTLLYLFYFRFCNIICFALGYPLLSCATYWNCKHSYTHFTQEHTFAHKHVHKLTCAHITFLVGVWNEIRASRNRWISCTIWRTYLQSGGRSRLFRKIIILKS